MIVADASPLIALAKMRRLEILREMYGQVLIGPVVNAEVVDQGRAVVAAGVEHVEDAIRKGWMQVARLTKTEKSLLQRILKSSRLDKGEAEALALASSRKIPVILDDREARANAELLELEFIGTAGILLEAFIKGLLTFKQLEEAVEELTKTMWLSPTVVAEILKRAREVKR